MLLAIDVGGTIAGALLVAGGAIRRQVKVPTDRTRILESILAGLDETGLKNYKGGGCNDAES